MFVLHLNWSNGSLRAWGEDSRRFTPACSTAIAAGTHPYALGADQLRAAVAPLLDRARAAAGDDARIGADGTIADCTLSLLLPYCETPKGPLPLPSDRLCACDELAAFTAEPEEALAPTEVPAIAFDARTAFALLRALAARR
jgi:hypothetical protein